MSHFTILRIISVLVGTALTALSFWFSYQHEREQIYQKFTSEVNAVSSSLELDMGRKIEVLLSFRSFYNTFGYISKEGFDAFSRDIQDQHSEIISIAWVPLVKGADRAAFEKKMHQGGSESFAIKEWSVKGGAPSSVSSSENKEGFLQVASPQGEYFPVTYSYPSSEAFPLGFDLSSNDLLRAALDITKWNNRPIAADVVQIGKGQESGYAYVVMLPVYGEGWTSETDKPHFLEAYVLGLFDGKHIFQEVMEDSRSWNANNMIALEYQSWTDQGDYRIASSEGENIDNSDDVFYQKKLAPVADMQWYLLARPSLAYFAKHQSYYPYALSLGLFVFTILIEAYLRILARMDGELQQMARVDSLTGIANRRRFFDQIDREWLRGQRFGRPMAVFLIDVDNFKSFNDTYGHLEGDHCLKQIAQELQRHINRPGDLLARYGGEEFSVLLPETSMEEALQVAEKCRAGVESLQVKHNHNEQWGVTTVSVGVACAVPDKNNEFGDLLDAADKVMYESKANGRNKVSAVKKTEEITTLEVHA